jgi:hypothetical protein
MLPRVLAELYTYRTPCVPPKLRAVEPVLAEALCAWLVQARPELRGQQLVVEEWVSNDSRCIPHWTSFRRAGGARPTWVVAKAPRRITRADLDGVRLQSLTALPTAGASAELNAV